MKRIFAFLLVIAMVISMSAAFAEEQNNWWNILLLGGDSRSLEDFERTDCITILSVNRATNEVKLTSIMRDTWVKIPGKGGNKINAAQVFGGPELTMQTVSENFGIELHNYAMVNMYKFVQIVDLVGGVDMHITDAEKENLNHYSYNYLTTVKEYPDGENYLTTVGDVHLNGLLALSHCRDRYTDSDYGRVMRQQNVLLTMAKKVQQMDINTLAQLIVDISGIVKTDLTIEDMKDLAVIGMQTNFDNAGRFRIPADGAFESGTFDGTWKIKPNLEKNQQLLKEFVYGAQ